VAIAATCMLHVLSFTQDLTHGAHAPLSCLCGAQPPAYPMARARSYSDFHMWHAAPRGVSMSLWYQQTARGQGMLCRSDEPRRKPTWDLRISHTYARIHICVVWPCWLHVCVCMMVLKLWLHASCARTNLHHSVPPTYSKCFCTFWKNTGILKEICTW
jgi:hypothetical protein